MAMRSTGETEKGRVQLHVYDLSMGLAAQMSQSILGRKVDAVYHTGVVVFGRELYYGAGEGIQAGPPASTSYGSPIQVLDMGRTEIDPPLLEELLQDLQEQFRGNKYHLLHNNCNHFSQELINFLVGKDIPRHILNLPQEIMSTPAGSFFANLISNLVQNQQQANASQNVVDEDEETQARS